MAEGSFELRPVGPYSLAASVRFLEGFTPAAYEGHKEGHLHLAFVADGGEDVAGELGPTVKIHGVRQHAFPGPRRLDTLEAIPGLTPRKVDYLRRLGREAAEQKLDAAYLRSLPEQEALAGLEE